MQYYTANGAITEQAWKRCRVGQAERGSILAQEDSTRQLEQQESHIFPNLYASGHAQVQQGNNYYYFYNGQQSQDKYEALLKSLTFDRMDARLHNVATALEKTSEWLIDHEQFKAWIDNSKAVYHHGFLWIKGKPGSGKSTIMKLVLTWAKGVSRSQIVISYFFNARSPNQLEKSSFGLYRSLLHQLLSAHQEIRPLFLAKFSFKERRER